jgi:hypothetical protein
MEEYAGTGKGVIIDHDDHDPHDVMGIAQGNEGDTQTGIIIGITSTGSGGINVQFGTE